MLLFCDLTFSSACGIILFASVVKLVDTVDSKSAAARLEGSNPFTRIYGLIIDPIIYRLGSQPPHPRYRRYGSNLTVKMLKHTISVAYVTILLQVFDISCIVWYNT